MTAPMKAAIAALALLVGYQIPVSLLIANAASDDQDVPPRVQTVRSMYRHMPSSILGIADPISVIWGTGYDDGGTIAIRLMDATGQELEVCLDRRLYISPRDSTWAQLSYSERMERREQSHLMYLDATYPTASGAHPVRLRGPEESAVYAMLIRWAEKNPFEPERRRDVFTGKPDSTYHALLFGYGLLASLDRRFSGEY